MKAEQFFEDWKDTFGTVAGNALSQYSDKKFAKLGSSGAAARVDLRNQTNALTQGWLAWLARHNFGPNKRVGNIDDLREYLKLAYGQATLDQLEPTIDKLIPTTPAVPAVPTVAAPGTTATPAPNLHGLTASQAAQAKAEPDPMDPAEQARRRAAGAVIRKRIQAASPPVPAIPALPVGATSKRTPTPHQVPNFLSRQRNQESVKYDLLSKIVETMETATPEQRAKLMSMSQRLQEDGPALNRSVIDQIMRQLAIDQYNTRIHQGNAAQPQQAATQQPAQPPAAQNPAQPQQQPQQQLARIDPDKIMQSQISTNGLAKALRTRRVALSSRDENAITTALSAHGGTMSLTDLVAQIHVVDAQTFPTLLYAMANS